MRWLPIESAPKDGTEILAWREDCGVLIVRWSSASDFMTTSEMELACTGDDDWMDQPDWFCADFIAGCRLEGSEAPTHWMPLPPPPSDEHDGLGITNTPTPDAPEPMEEA